MRSKLNKLFNKLISNNQNQNSMHFINTGKTGTAIYSGHFDEEYLNTFLNMPEGIDTYDQMRRSDAQITMLRNSIRNPILSANWFIESVDNTEEEIQKKDFINHVLFDDMGYPDGTKNKTWVEFLEEALSYLDFGFCIHEIVHKVVKNDPIWGNYIGIKDLGYRSQKTIYQWNLFDNGGIDNVWQQADGDLNSDAFMSGKNLIVLSNNKEGDNYEGISLLRPIYGNYFRKNIYYRLQSTGIERGITGTPIGTMPQDKLNDKAQIDKFIQIMQKYTQNQSNYILKPHGFDLDVFSLNYDPSKLDSVIENENKNMAKAYLANFMELGLSGSGSYALGSDLSDIFLNGIQLYANKICDQINRQVIKPLVIAKYGVAKKYPYLKVTGINDKAGKEKAEIVTMLVNAGIISPSDQLEDTLNRDFDLPVITEKQKVSEIKQNVDSLTEQKNITLAKPKDNATKLIKQESKKIDQLIYYDMLQRTNKYLDKASEVLQKTKKIGRRNALAKIDIPDKKLLKDDLLLSMARVTALATQNVKKELGLNPNLKLDELEDLLQTLTPESRAKLNTEIQAVTQTQDDEFKKRMFFIASQKIDTTDSVDALVADMRKARDSYINSGAFKVVATNLVSGSVNTARNSVFQTPEVFEEIESFEIVNPSPVAPICKELAGRVFTKDEYLTQDLPPYHHNCETTVKAQLKGQKNIKPVNTLGLTPTGTPDQVEAILKSKTFTEK
jgi:hypothetical protein